MTSLIRNLTTSLLAGLAALWLQGCAQDVAGKGGTELPGPLVVVYDTRPANSSVTVATGLQWRLWEQQDTLLMARASTTDSAGVVTLPNQSGIWVLEGWGDSLPARSPVSRGLRGGIPDSCLDTSASGALRGGAGCSALLPDSVRSSGRRPIRIGAVRVAGGMPPLCMRLADSLGNPLPDIRTARLWELDAGDSLRFAGELRRGVDGALRMPRLLKAGWFALEAWTGDVVLPGEVVGRQPVGGRASAFARCGGQLPDLPQDETVVLLHECADLGIAPSLTGAADPAAVRAPSRWALFGYQP